MSTTTTPNMGLTLPVPSSEPGPAWASELVAALVRLDAHTHVTDDGAAVPNSAIAVSADWSWAGYGARAVGFVALAAAAAQANTPRQLYADTDGELHWVDDDGHNLKLTLGGALNLTSNRGINGDYATDAANPSAFYTTSTKRYTLTHNGSGLAALRTGGLLLGLVLRGPGAGYTVTDTDGVTLVSCDTSTGASRNVNLPDAASNPGRLVIVKDKGGNASAANINVRCSGADSLDGGTSRLISTDYGCVRVVSDGTQWLEV